MRSGERAPKGKSFLSIDQDSWTCPHCDHTFRSYAKTAERRSAQRRAIRDNHKCPEVLPK